MEDLKQDISYLSNEASAYIDAEVKLVKLELVDQLSHYSASIFSKVVLTMMGGICYLMMLVSLGVYLYPLFEQAWIGPLIAFGVSIALFLLVMLTNKYIIQAPFKDYVISKLAKSFFS